MTIETKAAFARRHGVRRQALAKWETKGWLELVDGKVDVEASNANLNRYRHVCDGRAPAPPAERQPPVRQPRAACQPMVQRQPASKVLLTRRELIERLHALDWTAPFDWSDAAQRRRVQEAARAIGLEAVDSPLRDDGHHGGWQLRDAAAVAATGVCLETIHAGHGYELDHFEALQSCRDAIDLPGELSDVDLADELDVRLDLLPALAYPFGPFQRPD
jgi:hypothetical protein